MTNPKQSSRRQRSKKPGNKSVPVGKKAGLVKRAKQITTITQSGINTKQHERNKSDLAALRKKAQKKLNKQSSRLEGLSKKGIKYLVNELGTHQIELEMQNEELRLASSELETTRAKYADLYNFSPVGYFTLDKNGLIQDINFTSASMLGMEKKAIREMPFQTFIDPADRAMYREHLSNVFTTQTKQTCEVAIRKRDGSLSHVQLQSICHQMGEEKPTVCGVAMIDVNERWLSTALKESEQHYRSLFENMLHGFAFCKMLYDERDRPVDFVYLEVNSAFERLTGLVDVVGKKVTEVIPGIKEKHQDLLEAYSRVAQTCQPEKFEIEIKPLVLWLSMSVYSDKKGYFTVVFENSTARKRTESVMQARSHILEAATSSLSVDEVLQMTLDEIEAQTNSAIGFYHFLNADQETLSLQTWSTNTLQKMCNAEGKGRHYNISQAGVWVDCVREQRPVIHNEYSSLPHRRGLPPGHAPVMRELVVPIYRGGRIMAIIGVGNKPTDYNDTDIEVIKLLGDLSWEIVERKNAEQQLKETSAELALVNKDLEAFSYAVSHDLRTPLRHIEGFTNAILQDHAASLDAAAKDLFQRVVGASQRMSQLIIAMLNMSRMTRAEIKQDIVNLSDLAEVAAHELRSREPNRKTEFIIAQDVKTRGDISLLRAVLENLMNNAWKFSSKQSSSAIEFGSASVDGRVAYFVRDNGAGFPMQYADKLFMPFRRLHTESEFPGIGIGLSTVQRIIHRHGGRIWAEGEVDKGATFYFTLN